MEKEEVKSVADTMTKSLDNTQKNATDTEKAVSQVLTMSGKELHEKTVTAILSDGELSMDEKLDLIHRENADYERHQDNSTERVVRLQSVKTQNVGRATSWWSENWGWIAFLGATVLSFGTPQGRKLLTSVTHVAA